MSGPGEGRGRAAAGSHPAAAGSHPANRRPLRVGVNLLWLVPGVVGGSETYLVRSLLAVAALPPERRSDLEVTVFGLDQLADAHPDLAAAWGPLVTLRLRGRLKGARIAAESTWLAAQARRHRLDVLHHGGGALPPGRRLPGAASVVTVHDTQPLAMPANFSAVKRRWLGWMLPRVARRADLLVTTSDFVRTELVALGARPERVRLVPPCPPPAVDERRPAAAAVAARYGIGAHYAVYPAITYPHKNHAVLVEAMARPETPPELELVLAGGAGGAEQALRGQIDRLGLGGRVHRPGRLAQADLDALVSGAVAVAFPSTYEGFGVGVLEALALGAPVIAARATALPEVVEGAGMLVDPHDPEAWATALAELSREGPATRGARVAAGRRRAASFTAARTAEALTAAWRAAGELRRGAAPDRR